MPTPIDQEPAAPPYIERLIDELTARGSAPALRNEGRTLGADALLAAIRRQARALAQLGVGPGGVVAFFAPTCPDALSLRYAAHLLGAATAYLPALPSEAARQALLRQVDPSLLVVFPTMASLIPVGAGVPLAAMGDAAGPSTPRLDRLAAARSDAPLGSRARAADLAVLTCSGGSTGLPKAGWRDFAAYGALVDAPRQPARRQLVNGRLPYLSQALADMTLLAGGLVVLKDGYEAADTLATIEAERITDLFLVEPQLFELMDHPDVERRDLSSLRGVSHVGASAPPVLRLRARRRLGPVLTHTYGASEEGLVSVLTPPDYDPERPERLASAGRVRPGVELRLRRDDGTLAAPGEIGTIEVRSPALAGGYRNRPELQAAFGGGWYHSGDLGRLDAEGYLHIVGRAADVATAAGRLVTPTLIEERLCRLPSVRYAAAVAGREAGSWVVALEAWSGGSCDLRACAEALETGWDGALGASTRLIPVAKVPLTEQGKPDREAIRALGPD